MSILVHRSDTIFGLSSQGNVQPGAGTVTAYPPGGIVAATNAPNQITLYGGHGFFVNCKMMVGNDPSTYDGTTYVTAVDGNIITLNQTRPQEVNPGDILFNMGGDSSITDGEPAYDGSTLTIYSTPDPTNSIDECRVTLSETGGFEYWHNNLAIWELLRDNAGDPTGINLDVGATNGAGEIDVAAFATGGAGSESDPWSGWEQAFDQDLSGGARINFRHGWYIKNSYTHLPPNATSHIVVNGNGSTILLTGVSRFLDVLFTADYQTGQHIYISDFVIDASGATGQNAVLFGNYGTGLNTYTRVNWNDIQVKRVRCFGLTRDPNMTNHLGAILLRSIHATSNEAIQTTMKNIVFEDLRCEGGNWGFLVDGGVTDNSDNANILIDECYFIRLWHSCGVRATSFFYSSNFQIGERAKVKKARVIDCYGQYSGDDGLELNNGQDLLVTGTTIEDAFTSAFYYTNYNHTPGELNLRLLDCRAIVTGAINQGSGGGFDFINSYQTIPAGGRVLMDGCTYRNSGSTTYITNGPIRTAGGLAELSVVNCDFEWTGVPLDTASGRLIYISHTDDFTFRLKNTRLYISGTRTTGSLGLNAISTQTVTAGKTLTLDWDGVDVACFISGTTVSYTIFTSTILSSVASYVAGKVNNYRIRGVSNDSNARGLNIDLASATINPYLTITGCDGTALPSGGILVWLNNLVAGTTSISEPLKLIQSGNIEPGLSPKGGSQTGSTFLVNPATLEYMEMGYVTEYLTIAAAATTDTTIDLPANSIIRAVVGRVVVAIPTAATFSVGDPTTAARFGSGYSTALNTTFVGIPTVDGTGTTGNPRQVSSAKVRITPNLTPGTNVGRLRVTIFYEKFRAPQVAL